jgi:hypothetical protein
MFVRKAGAYPGGAPERSSPVGHDLSLTNKHLARLGKFAMVKHSSLLRTFVNYGRKKFYNIRPRTIKI